MNLIILERSELYEAVWARPLTEIAAEKGVSTARLVTACKEMAIPRPAQGHWTLDKMGRTPPRKRLPKLPKGKVERVRIHLYAQQRRKQPKVEAPAAATSDGLANPVIERTRKALLKAKADPERGTVTPRGRVLPIVVSPEQAERALSVFAGVLAVAEANRWKFRLRKRNDDEKKPYWSRVGPFLAYAAELTVDGVVLDVSLSEKVSRSSRPMTAAEKKEAWPWFSSTQVFEYRPSGNLTFFILGIEGTGGRQRWADSKTARLETKVDDIAIGLAAAAVLYKEREMERERKAREGEEGERRASEERERQRVEAQRLADEKRRVDELVRQASAHTTAQRIRALVHDVRLVSHETEDWASWALRVAETIDPVQELARSQGGSAAGRTKSDRVGH